MKKPAWVLAGLLLIIGGAAAYLLTHLDLGMVRSPVGTPTPTRDTAFDQELERIRSAEKIDDPVARCLAYPDPSEFHWDRSQVEQLCKKRTWRMVSWKEIRQALNDRHPEKLDAAFESYLALNYSGPEWHGYLTWTYWWMFQNPSKEEREVTQQWVDEDPGSAYALAARGIHYSQAAYDARGANSARTTSDAQFAHMRELVDKARADLEASLKINPRLIAAYHGLLRISRLGGSDAPTFQWVQSALALDAADPWIYSDWSDDSQPQWGGSAIKMAKVAELAATHAKENPLLATLKAEPLCNEGDQLRCTQCGKDYAKALDFYKQAGGFGPAACFIDGAGAAAAMANDVPTSVRYYSQAVRFVGGADWYAYRAQALRSIGENEWALRDLDKALAGNSRNTTALYSKGFILASMRRLGDAESTYLKLLAIDPNHRDAGIALSILYLDQNSPLLAPDKARPLVTRLVDKYPAFAQAWLLKAAIAYIDKDSAGYIDAGEKYLSLVDQSNPSNQNDIDVLRNNMVTARQTQKTQTPSDH